MIIASVVRFRKNRENVQQRILAAMSVCDLIFAFMMLTGSLWFLRNPTVPAIGNETSCDFQGFINIVMIIATLLYNDALALYYLLVVKFNWTPSSLKKIEKWLHIAPFTVGFTYATAAAALDGIDSYRSWSSGCFITHNTNLRDDHPNVRAVQQLFLGYLFIVCFAIIFSLCCLLMVYFHVRATEAKSSRWGHLGRSRMIRTKLVAKQCLLFFLVIALPWTFFMVYGILSTVGIYQEWMDMLEDFFVPLGGILNGLVYFRLRFGRLRREYPNTPRRKIVFGIIRDKIFPCCCTNFTYEGAVIRDSIKVSFFSVIEDDGKDLEPTLEDEVVLPPEAEEYTNDEGGGGEKDHDVIQSLRSDAAEQQKNVTNNCLGEQDKDPEKPATSLLGSGKKKRRIV